MKFGASWKRRSTPIVSCLILGGCCSLEQLPTPTPLPPVTFHQSCSPLPMPQEKLTMGELLQYANEVVQMYGECAGRHNAWVESQNGRN